MRYSVTYLMSGQLRTDRVEALDAAAAVAAVHAAVGRVAVSFELLSVLLLDEGTRPRPPRDAERAPTP